MRGGVFVGPILLNIRHAFAPGDFSRGSEPVKGAAFRTVAEGFEPVLFLWRIPLVYDHLHRHPAAPDTGGAFGIVGPGIQTTMSASPVHFQVRRHAMIRRSGRCFTLGILDDLEPARLVERRHLLPRVFERHGTSAQFHACLEPVLSCAQHHRPQSRTVGLPAAGPVDAKHLPQVAVGPLIERPREPDAGLNSHDTAGHVTFSALAVEPTISLSPIHRVCTGPGVYAEPARRST